MISHHFLFTVYVYRSEIARSKCYITPMAHILYKGVDANGEGAILY